MSVPTVQSATIPELCHYYDTVLNLDKTTYTSSNDEPTPTACVREMFAAVPDELWHRPDLRILDPCCGSGNFGLILLEKLGDTKNALENVIDFCDINEMRLENVRRIFGNTARVYNRDFLEHTDDNTKYDLICANPPYARILTTGKRAAKNHNMIGAFIDTALSKLKDDGYMVYISPDNWMSCADRNTIVRKLTSLHIVHLDIHSAKRHFKKIGSSFTWYIIQNRPCMATMSVSGIWKKREYTDVVSAGPRDYIPLLYSNMVYRIMQKTVDNTALPRFGVLTSSDLHKYTKAAFIVPTEDATHPYRLIHTPKQTVWSSRPHKFQTGWKVFISTTDKYACFADNCGMTQSIAFIPCDTEADAIRRCGILGHDLYRFINNICRYGNFGNVRILQRFPEPIDGGEADIYAHFGITPEEIAYINAHL